MTTRGTALPLASVTDPVIRPVLICAQAKAAPNATNPK
jgi:hypothetical protein